MNKQFPMATITMLILSACCSALPQGAVAMDTSASSASAVAPVETSSAAPVAPPTTASSGVVTAPPNKNGSTLVSQPGPHTAPAPNNKTPASSKKSNPAKKQGRSKVAVPRKPTVTSQAALPAGSKNNLPSYNRPYPIDGKLVTPLSASSGLRQRGDATWYNRNKQGKPTVNGEIYDPYGLTAAHPTLPIPSYARVTNLSTGKSIVVRINDRGPEDAGTNHKIIELSFSAANKIGLVSGTNRKVEVRGLENDQPTPASPSGSIAFHLKRERKDSKDNKATPNRVASTSMSTGTYLQLGAFRSQAAAERYAAQIRPKLTSISSRTPNSLRDGALFRLWLGPYPSSAEAQHAAEALAPQLGFKPLLKVQAAK